MLSVFRTGWFFATDRCWGWYSLANVSWGIFRTILLTKVCPFFTVATVVLHVHDQYSRTGLTFLLKIPIFVCNASSLGLQVFFNCRKVALAFTTLAILSVLVPSYCLLHYPDWWTLYLFQPWGSSPSRTDPASIHSFILLLDFPFFMWR